MSIEQQGEPSARTAPLALAHPKDAQNSRPSPELRARMDEVSGQAGAQTLARALSLAEGFHFAIVACKSSRSAAALQLWLAEILVAEDDEPVAIDRVSPYPLDPVAAGPGVLDPDALVESVFAGLLPATNTETSSTTTTPKRLVVLDATRATSASSAPWRALFMRLNERRNLLMRDLGGSLTLLLPEALEVEFARAAPDLWSIRRLTITVDERLTTLPSARVLLQARDDAYSSGEDPGALSLEVERLRARARGGSPTVRRALRVLLLRLAGSQQRLGELDESLALIDEAEQISGMLGDRDALAACWMARSEILARRGEFDGAHDLLRDAIAELEQGTDRWTHAGALGQVADILAARGQLDEALRIRREEQLPVYERLGDVRSRAVTMGQVADILQARGELDEALRIRREEQLPVYERLGDVRGLLIARTNLALLLLVRGPAEDKPEAASLLGTALRDAQRLRLPEAAQIANLIRQLGIDPDTPPVA